MGQGQSGYKVIVSKNAIFNENDFPCYNTLSIQKPIESTPIKETVLESQTKDAVSIDELTEVKSTQFEIDYDQHETEIEIESTSPFLADYQLTSDKESRSRIPSTMISNDDFVTLLSVLHFLNSEPTTFEEVVNCPDKKQ